MYTAFIIWCSRMVQEKLAISSGKRSNIQSIDFLLKQCRGEKFGKILIILYIFCIFAFSTTIYLGQNVNNSSGSNLMQQQQISSNEDGKKNTFTERVFPTTKHPNNQDRHNVVENELGRRSAVFHDDYYGDDEVVYGDDFLDYHYNDHNNLMDRDDWIGW